MAITQVTQYNSTPTVVGDYSAQNKHIQAFINQTNNHSFILTNPTATTIPAIALGTYISSGGTLFLVDTANYTILGSVASGNNYIKMSVSGTTLTATWIQDVSAYTYNPIYGYMASGTDMILPYLVTYDGSSVYNKYRNDITQYVTDQNLRTTDSPTFVEVTTTNGPNKPVDYVGSTMPEVKIGGFISGGTGTVTNVKLPLTGTYMVIATQSGGTNVFRYSGGTVISLVIWLIALRIS